MRTIYRKIFGNMLPKQTFGNGLRVTRERPKLWNFVTEGFGNIFGNIFGNTIKR